MFAKICGITRVGDALHAAEEGATAVGFVFWPSSPRYVTPERAAAIVAALPAHVQAVGVFVNERVEEIRRVSRLVRLTAVQLHGEERADGASAIELPILRAVSLDAAATARAAWPAGTILLLDAVDPVRRGGTGARIDWRRAADVASLGGVVLAGGLTAENVTEAIETVRPFGVDVSSGVESEPGVKDGAKVAQFLRNATAAFARTEVVSANRGEGGRGE